MNNLISNPTLKSSQFWSPLWLQVDFDAPDTKTFLLSIQTLETSHFRPLHKNQIDADPPHWNDVIFDHAHKNQTYFIAAQNEIKSNSIHHTEIKSIWTTHTKLSQFSWSYQKQVISGQHTSNKSIATTYTQPNQFHPYTEIKSGLIPTLRSSRFRSSPKPSQSQRSL